MTIISNSKTILQNLKGHDKQNRKILDFYRFITITNPNSYKQAFKRACFALQKGIFYNTKDALLKIN